MFLAKALYDNIAESPDELAFRRGDVITVTELDTGGLDGWWLCTLRGKQGIAPGNRLKILSGMSDYSVGDENHTKSRLTPSFSMEKMLDVSGQRGNIIEEPTRQMPDYDVPPSRYCPNEHLQENSMKSQNSMASRSSIDSLDSELSSLDLSLYDTPPKHKVPVVDVSETYDVPPPALSASSSVERLSNRCSFQSDVSNDSMRTTSSFASNSNLLGSPMVSESPRSSAEISCQEIYDTPSKNPVRISDPTSDSLNLYDSPPKTKVPVIETVGLDYDTPKDGREVPPKVADKKTKSKILEHAVDDIYDVPHNNAPLPVKQKTKMNMVLTDVDGVKRKSNDQLCVYDIPPQVTRDSVISARSDSSDDSQRLSNSSLDSRGSLTDIPAYDGLPLELDAALELLTKHQQAVQKAVSKLLGFVSSTWRKKASLQRQLYDIKSSSVEVKILLSEFIKFAQGTLGNSAKLPDRKLLNRLYKHVNPLQNSFQLLSSALKNLDELNWQPDLLAEPLDSSKSDDLGQIVTVCKDMNGHVRKLASCIQGNGILLFPRTKELLTVSNADSRASPEGVAAAKPPIGPKPDVAAKSVQQRPLPAPPVTERPLPPTPIENQMKQLRHKFEDDGDYCLEKDFKKEDIYVYDTGEWIRDYDYVHLETKDTPEANLNVSGTNSREMSPAETEPEQGDNSVQLEDSYERKLEAELENLDTSSKEDIYDHPGSDQEQPLKEEILTPVNVRTSNENIITAFPENELDLGNDQLDPNDRHVLVFYAGQMETHCTLLDNALDAFFCCVESNEPPKVFISHSKFVVVSAHKLVYIGDTLHRNVMHTDVREKIMKCANQLCDRLKLSVNATKMAALQYPSVPQVQDMVDKVVEVSKAANKLKLVISQAASL